MLKQQAKELADKYDIETMTVQELEAHATAMSEDYSTVLNEAEEKIDALKMESCKKSIHHHHALKDIDNYKNQAQKLKNNLDKEKKHNAFLKETLNENESARARLTNELEEVRVKMKMQEDMKSHVGKLESALAMKSNTIVHLRKRIKEYEDSYEIS